MDVRILRLLFAEVTFQLSLVYYGNKELFFRDFKLCNVPYHTIFALNSILSYTRKTVWVDKDHFNANEM
jgi:hypothetical protein